jgi:uncharacterized membrane protein
MSTVHDEPTPSRVAFLKHPLHPMTVVFPIAFFTATPAADLTFWLRGDPFWALAAFWLATAGFVLGIVAALLGIAEFLLMKEVRNRLAGWTHLVTGLMALALAGANVQLRLADPVAAVLPWGILLSAAMALMVGVAGWIGGTLTFGHGIGTYVHGHDAHDYAELNEPRSPDRRRDR